MRVSLEHAKLFVPANRRDLCYVQPLFEQAADALVPKVVEAKVVHFSADAKVLESKPNRIARNWKNTIGVSTLVSLQVLEDRYGAA
jgi:hypothetical protein